MKKLGVIVGITSLATLVVGVVNYKSSQIKHRIKKIKRP